MRRALFACCLLFAGIIAALAQVGPIGQVPTWPPKFSPTSVSYQGPGDVISGATAWCSPARAYKASYATGSNPALGLEDQAGANPITINILATGFVDVASISAWVTAHSVTTIKVNECYDQTGNGNHFTQATLANMPSLVLNEINSLPAFSCGGGTQDLVTSGNITAAQPFSMSAVFEGTSGGEGGILGGSSGAYIAGGNNKAAIGITATDSFTATATNNAFHGLQALSATGTNGAVLSVDNTETTGTTAAVLSATTLRVCRNGSGGTTLTGFIAEAGLWGSTGFSGTQRTNIFNNQNGSSGYNGAL